MEQEEKQGSIKKTLNLLSHWFSAEEPSGTAPGSTGSRQPPAGAPQEESVKGAPGDSGVSHAVETISEKLAVLKDALDFETGQESRLNEVHTHRELLLYFHDVLLPKLERLGEIGVMTRESSRLIRHLEEKTVTMLAAADPTTATTKAQLVEELSQENEDLKREMASLRYRYLKSGIVTDTVLALEKEVKYLQNIIRDQRMKIKLAGKKIATLLPYPEMVRTLRAETSMLQSKVDHQSRLLETLTANRPKHERWVSHMEKLGKENRDLKTQLEKQAGLLEQMKALLPPGAGQTLEDLLSGNARLQTDLEEKRAWPDEMISEKEERIQVLTDASAERPALKAFLQLQHQFQQLREEHKAIQRLYAQAREEKENLVAQVRDRASLIQENRRLKTERDSTIRYGEILRKLEFHCTTLKRERTELRTKCESLTLTSADLERKLAAVTAEYRMLLKEYENIFGAR